MWILFFVGVGILVAIMVAVLAYSAMHEPGEESEVPELTEGGEGGDAAVAAAPGAVGEVAEARPYNIGMTFNLRPGSYAEYKKAHDELWPDIAASMSDNGVDMAIFRFGEQLFLHATAPTRQDWLKSREHPALAKWSEYMTGMLVTDDTGEIVFHEMENAFTFGAFAPTAQQAV